MAQFASEKIAKYYAYIHARPDGRIFYVGKGCHRRAYVLTTSKRNEYHARVCNKYGRENIQINTIYCSTEANAYSLEAGLIKCLTRMGVALVNQVAGGRGGVSPSVEVRKKHSDNTKRMMQQPAIADKIKKAQKLAMTAQECAERSARTKKLWQDPAYRAKAIQVREGHAWNKGYKCTPEQVFNRRKAARISNMKRNYGIEWATEYRRRYPEHMEDLNGPICQ